jgi:hypothetical protein
MPQLDKNILKNFRNTINIKWSVVILTLFYLPAYSQTNVTGPQCVVPGTTYQYLISGKWDSSSTMQVCLTGGNLAAKAVNCTSNGKPVPFVQVVWNPGTGGTIQITSSSGTANLQVNIAGPLTGGTITDSFKTKSIAFSNVPATIHCSASTGGSCSPSFSYQWQQSFDNVSWTNISGAQGQDLNLSSPLKTSMFFRRKVTEISSGSVAYSDFETVNVAAPAPSTSIWMKSFSSDANNLAVNF